MEIKTYKEKRFCRLFFSPFTEDGGCNSVQHSVEIADMLLLYVQCACIIPLGWKAYSTLRIPNFQLKLNPLE